jgi:hypothetical protein
MNFLFFVANNIFLQPSPTHHCNSESMPADSAMFYHSLALNPQMRHNDFSETIHSVSETKASLVGKAKERGVEAAKKRKRRSQNYEK